MAKSSVWKSGHPRIASPRLYFLSILFVLHLLSATKLRTDHSKILHQNSLQCRIVGKGKGLLFNVGSLRKYPPGMDGRTYFQQSQRCISLPPR